MVLPAALRRPAAALLSKELPLAKVNINRLLDGLRGKIKGVVFRSMPDGSTVVSSRPTYKKGKSTPKQNEYRRGTFKERTQWAKWAQHAYPIYAELAAGRPMITAYNLALQDISHSPEIHRMIREDGRILVQASDSVLVNMVKVDIRDEQGNLLERGDAVRLGGDIWAYAAKTEGKKVVAQAFDIPGNCAKMVLE